MANSKKKGSRFELKVSKWFTQWTKYTWNRVPMSGAWHQNKDAASDITCVDEKHAHRCKISVECKNYKEINFEHVLLGNKSCDILKFWDQAVRDAKRAKKVPILCMRYNSMPAQEFFFVVGSDIAKVFYEKLDDKSNIMILNVPKIEELLYIFMASHVINHVDYKEVHKQAKLILK